MLMQIYISANTIKEMEFELLTEEDGLTRRSNCQYFEFEEFLLGCIKFFQWILKNFPWNVRISENLFDAYRCVVEALAGSNDGCNLFLFKFATGYDYV